MSAPDRSALVAAHRHVADLLEANPEIVAPCVYNDGSIHWTLWPFECPDGVPAMVAKIRRIVGGKWTKHEAHGISGDPEMYFKREGYEIRVKRDAVCTRRVVGTREVVKPAISLPERTETVEIVEWDCHPVLEASS